LDFENCPWFGLGFTVLASALASRKCPRLTSLVLSAAGFSHRLLTI